MSLGTTGGGTAKISGQNIPNLGQLSSIAEAILKQVGPVRKELLGQTLEALKTGGVGAQIPIIQRAVENSKAATGAALNQTQSQLGSAGLAGTPYGQDILASTRTSGDLATSQIPTNIASAFISGAPGLVSSTQAQGLSALQGASSLQLQQQIFNAEQSKAFLNALQSAIAGWYGGGPQGQGGSFTLSSPSTSNAVDTSSSAAPASSYGPYASGYQFDPQQGGGWSGVGGWGY